MLNYYQAVLGPGASIAGPYAESLREGRLTQHELHWLQANFFKTELELGHCLRLPQEGPCECDLYLSCAKFVTTREYAPRLRRRRKRELELIEDGRSRGWQREVERHQCTVRRIEQLLADLASPLKDQKQPIKASYDVAHHQSQDAEYDLPVMIQWMKEWTTRQR